MFEYLGYKIYMISGATLADSVLIRAHMRSLYNKRYHCNVERESMEKRLNNPEATDTYKETIKERLALRKLQKGCGVILNKVVDIIGNIEFKTCLCKLKHPMFDDLVFMNNQFNKGIMPFEGGLLDQPAQIIELLRVVQDAKDTEEQERVK